MGSSNHILLEFLRRKLQFPAVKSRKGKC